MFTRTTHSNDIADLATYRRRQFEREHSSTFSRVGTFVIGALLMLTIIAFITMNVLIRSADVAGQSSVELGGTLTHTSTVTPESN